MKYTGKDRLCEICANLQISLQQEPRLRKNIDQFLGQVKGQLLCRPTPVP